jgi:hypothetical protein
MIKKQENGMTEAMDALVGAGMLPEEDDAQFAGIDQLFMGRPDAVKFDAMGDAVTGKIVDLQSQQARDFETGAPKFYPDGRPIMEPVVIMQVDGIGLRTLYCGQGVRRAIGDAVRGVNFTRPPDRQVPGIRKDGYLHVTWVSTDEPRRKGAKGVKVYQAEYVPPGRPPIGSVSQIAPVDGAGDIEPPF